MRALWHCLNANNSNKLCALSCCNYSLFSILIAAFNNALERREKKQHFVVLMFARDLARPHQRWWWWDAAAVAAMHTLRSSAGERFCATAHFPCITALSDAIFLFSTSLASPFFLPSAVDCAASCCWECVCYLYLQLPWRKNYLFSAVYPQHARFHYKSWAECKCSWPGWLVRSLVGWLGWWLLLLSRRWSNAILILLTMACFVCIWSRSAPFVYALFHSCWRFLISSTGKW